ncbi:MULTISPECIES: exodeoxyribonuclease VII small subunit [Terrabacteria group]|uniref:exodeoxyribonuclease VII small subunit n=1 Tax=Bacillati TaxID=1783272 RepID=UPI0019394B8B|nr:MULTISPECIES: exodeoxyribonuclease VII small subunit [Terrabacteria group]MBW9211804.1 exodeoxyribonuclease VII small subunit [Trueperella sp. zg.1013]QRG87391.1 exodeoxyribonuclease VII small subunit [Bulleidia sp. zg-1006]
MEELKFEDAMKRLEKIVKQLESNEAPLEETISLFEEGLSLAKQCDQQLKKFEKKVTDIVKENKVDSE